MKTYAIITIEHPDDMTAEHLLNYAVRPAINDMKNDSQPEWQLSLSKSITKNELERKALVMSLDRVLSDYPYEIEPEEVTELIEQEHESILVWVNYEHLTPSEVLGEIYAMQASFLSDLIYFFKEGK